MSLLISIFPQCTLPFNSCKSFDLSYHRNWTRYPISESDFRAAYSSVSNSAQTRADVTNPYHICFLPLLFVVLAISVRLAPEDVAGDARNRRLRSLRYYWACASFPSLHRYLS